MRTLKLCFVLVALIMSCKNKTSITLENGLLINNVTILTPDENGYSSFKGNIIIDNDKIVKVTKDEYIINGDFHTLNGKGKFVIPGLIDSHVHLASIAGMGWKHKKKYPDLAKAYYNQLPKSYLYFGYTTLIDVNNYNPNVINGILRKTVRPDIYTCGDQIVVAHDLMMNETPAEDRFIEHPHFLHDKYNENVEIPTDIDLSKHTPKTLVSRIVDENEGICVKTLYEDGFGGTEELTWELPSKEIIIEIVAEAHSQGVPVLLHANAYEAQKFGLETGIDVFAHGMWHWGNLTDYLNINELPETHKNLLIEIANKKVGYQPTIRVVGGQKDVFNVNFLENLDLQHVYPEDQLNWLNTLEGKWQEQNIRKYAKSFFDGLTNEEIMTLLQKVVDKVEIATNTLAEHDANLIFGTDTPAANTHTMPPGLNGYLEMQKWQQSGVSLEQILLAATYNNAKAFNLDDKYGSIEETKIANLLLLDKNPLETIEAYNSIEKVIVRGQLLNRENLSATHN